MNSQKNDKARKTKMKNRKKYFVAHFITDLYFMDDEHEVFYAESKEAVEKEMREALGEHLLAVSIRKATWRERRMAKQGKLSMSITH